MDRVMVSVAGGAMGSLLRKVGSLTAEQVSRLLGVPEDIEWLKRELASMQAFLMVLSDIEDPDEVVKCSKDELRELSYNMEDAIDRFELQRGHGTDDKRSPSSSTYGFMGSFQRGMGIVKSLLVSRHAMAAEIQRLKDLASEAERRRERYRLEHPARHCALDTRVVSLYREAINLVGIDRPSETIIPLLTGGDRSSSSWRQRTVVSIVGFGGIGKTTLAKQIFDRIKGEFDCAAFVSVSRKPRINEIIMQILFQFQSSHTMAATGQLDLHGNLHVLASRLRTYLQDKRYFVVVDDIWDKRAWSDIIGCGLFDNRCGSRIITTTRVLSVAKWCSSGDSHTHRMEPLCPEDSRRLFLKRVFDSEVCPDPMESALAKILKKCGGSPLAILTVSSILVDKVSPNQWEQVCDLIGLGICEDDDVSAMRRILSHSYFDLPHHLRTCLLYLSLFPEDYVIKRKRLVYRWIAEGFIHARNGQNMTEVGDSYFHELINRSLIQPVKINYIGKVSSCRVHDTILDFIVSVSIEESFAALLGVHGQRLHKKIRHLSVKSTFETENNSHLKLLEEQGLSHVRSLTMFDRKINRIPSGLTNLRVLDLQYCNNGYYYRYSGDTDGFIGNVTELSYLKYLALPYSFSKVERLPEEFGNLQHLQTLDMSLLSDLKELPATFYKLRSLVHLIIPCSACILPDGIGNMTALEELQVINVTVQSVKFLRELGQLTRLMVLGVGFQSGCTEGVKERVFLCSLRKLDKCNLRSLFITDSYDGDGSKDKTLNFPSFTDDLRQEALLGLRKIDISPICGVPDWMGSLRNLEKVKLQFSDMWQNGLDILGGLQNLLCLHLCFTFDDIDEMLIFRGNKGFQSLKYLSIIFPMGKGSSRTKILMFQAASLPRIEHLKLDLNCTSSCTGHVNTTPWEVHTRTCKMLSDSKITDLYDFGIENLSSLFTLEVENRCCLPVAMEISETTIKNAASKLPNCSTLIFKSSLKIPKKEIDDNNKKRNRKKVDAGEEEEEEEEEEEDDDNDNEQEEEEDHIDVEEVATSSTAIKRQRLEKEPERCILKSKGRQSARGYPYPTSMQVDESYLTKEYAQMMAEWKTSMHNYNIIMQKFIETPTTSILPPPPPPPPPPPAPRTTTYRPPNSPNPCVDDNVKGHSASKEKQ